MRLHIEKKHGGLGVAEQIYGRRESAYSQKQDKSNFGRSTLENSFSKVIGMPEDQFFDNSDPIEAMLAKGFEGIIPKFLELERLLRSCNFPERNIRILLGHIVLAAIMSSDPIQHIENSVKVWTKKYVIQGMLVDICIANGINENSIKDLYSDSSSCHFFKD